MSNKITKIMRQSRNTKANNRLRSKAILKGLPILDSIRTVERKLNGLSYDFEGNPYATSAVAEKILHDLEPDKIFGVVAGSMADDDHPYVEPAYKAYPSDIDTECRKMVKDPKTGFYHREGQPPVDQPHFWIEFNGYVLDFTQGIYRPVELVYGDYEQWVVCSKGNLTPLYESIPDRVSYSHHVGDFSDWALDRYPLIDHPVCEVDKLVDLIKVTMAE